MTERAGEAAAPWRIVAAELETLAPSVAAIPPEGGPEVAFAGRSNVGKSSLMNALCERRRLVRTSATPGCTRALGFFVARARDGRVFRLVDLPGYGFARRSQAERAGWGELIERYFERRTTLVATVVIVDARHGATEADRELLAWLVALGRPPALLVAATKLDKVAASRRLSTVARLRAALARPVLGVSATTGEGIAALWGELRAALSRGPT
jgi:GTP-binding protein